MREGLFYSGESGSINLEQADEIFGFMDQSRISEKNVSRLKALLSSPDAHIADLADIVLKIAKIKPHKRRRMQILTREHPGLLERAIKAGLVLEHQW